ncbi:MAG: hypothetical protein CL878_15020 [Dehalococcoidia bacterium]|nr:hypothetical protein [Dehalococcoidia bacterium]
MGALVVLGAGRAFRTELRGLIARISSATARFQGTEVALQTPPGPGDLSGEDSAQSAPQHSQEEQQLEQGQEDAPGELDRILALLEAMPGTALDLEEQRQVAQELREQVEQGEQRYQHLLARAQAILDEERQLSQYWRFRFLASWLVPTTQKVLRWFASVEMALTRESDHILWTPSIPNAHEREIIWVVLQNAELLEANEQRQMRISELGREFVAFQAARAASQPAARAAS